MKFARNPYEYRRNLPHLTKADRAHFITFNTWARWELPFACRDLVLDAFRFHDGTKYDLFAVVVMPEHVHAILVPLRDRAGDPFSTAQILHSLKSFTANRIHEHCPEQRRVWQDESLDHVIRHEESLDEKIEYIRMNPVRRGLVKDPADYRWLWVRQFDS